jgi:hypothetical protein
MRRLTFDETQQRQVAARLARGYRAWGVGLTRGDVLMFWSQLTLARGLWIVRRRREGR